MRWIRDFTGRCKDITYGGDNLTMQLNAAEAFKTALNVETAGEKFYSDIAKKMSGNQTKEMFLKLASDERDHQSDFERLINEISGMEKEIEMYSDSEEIDGYLNAVMATNIFKNIPSVEKLIADTKSDTDAIKIAIEAEKTAILYYTGLLEIFKNDKARDIFSRILTEERKHLKNLADTLTIQN